MSLILVDTSIWIEHLRYGSKALADALTRGVVLSHPMVIGELALGHLKDREDFLSSVKALTNPTMALDLEVLAYIENHQLHGRGIGYVDANLLVSTALTPGAKLWTQDRRLAGIAGENGIAHEPSSQ
ncbi:PIN domain-containing protein [Arthrobacter sp. H5]|uniref:type II toxin-antitoxin system VapC family toxin n=1 Tax=Arthrobacter sp. H5 TaxID=1267973 RepID=UPI001C1E77FB|nr:PIN domain-containing protein [Arthrobacter sp. H5]